MNPDAYEHPVLRLPLFEGPLELLLSLVERRRLPITGVSLAAVADQYLAHVRRNEIVDRDALSEFLVIAAQLTLIKSRAVLPQFVRPDDVGTESAGDLVARLEAYRVFKLLATEIGDIGAEAPLVFARGLGALGILMNAKCSGMVPALEAISAGRLARMIERVEGRTRPPSTGPEAAIARMSVAERLAVLRERLSRTAVVSWDDVAGTTVDELVATLLAVLELVRRGELAVHQPRLFGPIQLCASNQATVAAGCSPILS